MIGRSSSVSVVARPCAASRRKIARALNLTQPNMTKIVRFHDDGHTFPRSNPEEVIVTSLMTYNTITQLTNTTKIENYSVIDILDAWDFANIQLVESKRHA